MLKIPDTVVAGYWNGEFGWELFCWQAYLRKLSRNYKIIVVGKEGHELLYEDFCTKYICSKKPLGIKDLSRQLPENYIYLNSEDKHVFYNVHNSEDNKNFNHQEFIKFGQKDKHCYDLLIHVRNEPLKEDKINRNFGKLEDFETLIKNFRTFKIATIGTSKSLYVKGTDDLRGMPLNVLANVLANSTVVIGALSGPIHFAALCQCPHITWSNIPENKKRCEIDWNPFKTPVSFHLSHEIPQEIYHEIHSFKTNYDKHEVFSP